MSWQQRWRQWWHARSPAAHAGRVADAEQEAELSRQRLHETRETVTGPLRAYADQNHFATLIAASLAQGHRRGTAG